MTLGLNTDHLATLAVPGDLAVLDPPGASDATLFPFKIQVVEIGAFVLTPADGADIELAPIFVVDNVARGFFDVDSPLTIADGAQTSGFRTVDNPEEILPAGVALALLVQQVGSTEPGADLKVIVRYRQQL